MTEVTRIDSSRKEMFHGGPDFLPDGRQFLYARLGSDADDSEVYMGSLDARPEQQSSKRLLTGITHAVYAPSSDPGLSAGYLLFTRGGSLMAQAFNLRRGELGRGGADRRGLSRGPRPFSASMTGVLTYRTGYAEYDGTVSSSDGSIGEEKRWKPPESLASMGRYFHPTEPASR